MYTHPRRALVAVLVIALTACTIKDDRGQTDDDEIGSPTGPSARTDQLEFRVIGNIPSARIRASDSINGLTQTTTGLPWYYSTASTRSNVFLSLDAVALEPAAAGTGILQVQIVVNGEIFREASAVGYAPIVSVSGTFRR